MSELRQVGYDDARALVDALETELRARYQDEAATHADAAQFVPPAGVFYVVLVDGEQVACGGLRTVEPGLAEIKRMYVDPAHRGRGLSRVVLQALVGFAREQGFHRVALETGEKQPEAIGLYESAGFVRVGPYGEWVGSGVCSLFFGIKLSGP